MNLQAGFIAAEKAGGNTKADGREMKKKASSHHAFITITSEDAERGRELWQLEGE